MLDFLRLNLDMIWNIAVIVFFISTTGIVYVKKVIDKIKNGKLIEILGLTKEFVKEAETHVNFSGAEKKEYVMNKLKIFSMENKMNITDEELSDMIERDVDLTKTVNSVIMKTVPQKK